MSPASPSIAGRYTIDSRRSSVEFSGRSSVHPIEIRSKAPHGDLVIGEGARPSVAGHLVVPVRSLRTGQPMQDLELRRQLKMRQHPTIEAEVQTLRHVGDDDYEAAGDITFLGETMPAQGKLGIRSSDGTLHIVGSSTFDVRDFGMQPPRILGLRVDAQVMVRINVVASRA